MADFVSMDELWDVGSVFRGFFSEPAGSSSDFPEWFEQPSREQQDQGFGMFDDFPGFLEATTPVLGDHLVGLVTHSPSEVKENLQFHFQEEAGSSTTVAATSSDDTVRAPSKYKRRKNQQKRVVKHVQAEDVSSDLWAWRKYGQKPIKGSPFPRSYYRCSSSKGCVARKQVERSSSDTGMFIVTYTGEHSHAHPTRRSSLAGTTRNSTKFPTSSSSLGKQSPTTTTPTPTLTEDLGNDYTNSAQLQSVCGSNQTDEKSTCVIPRLIFSDETDEMFMGLDELEMAEWPWIQP